jgi:hypothetical protein
MAIEFCPKCHREVYRTISDEKGVKIVQGAKTVIHMGPKSKIGSMTLNCPAGHPIKIKNLHLGEQHKEVTGESAELHNPG